MTSFFGFCIELTYLHKEASYYGEEEIILVLILFNFNRKFFSFDIHILLCLYFFWKLFCLLGNSFILQHWVNYYISLGNSFILIQYESKIILLCIYFFWRLFVEQIVLFSLLFFKFMASHILDSNRAKLPLWNCKSQDSRTGYMSFWLCISWQFSYGILGLKRSDRSCRFLISSYLDYFKNSVDWFFRFSCYFSYVHHCTLYSASNYVDDLIKNFLANLLSKNNLCYLKNWI